MTQTTTTTGTTTMAASYPASECFQQAKPCLCGHVGCLLNDTENYLVHLEKVRTNPKHWSAMSSALRARIIAALHICKQHTTLDIILKNNFCEIIDFEKAVTLLDRPRQIRQLRSKIEKIERNHPHLLQIDDLNIIDDEEKKDAEPAPTTATPTATDDAEPVKKKRRVRKIDEYRNAVKALRAAMSGGGEESDHKGEPCEHFHSDSAVQEMIESASVSGSFARKVRKWAKTLKPDFLEYVMLEMPKAAWTKVADLVHFKPGDFSVDYFLTEVHGGNIPTDSFVYVMRQIINNTTDGEKLATDFAAAAKKFPQIYKSYASLRTKPALMKNASVVEDLAENVPLEIAIWYFEEMYKVSKTAHDILKKRLDEAVTLELAANSDSKVFAYGKLMERILTFDRLHLKQLSKQMTAVAALKLSQMKESWASVATNGRKIAVFGDASYSMQSAIEAATIFAAMVSVCLDGDLSFFSYDVIHSPHKKPSTVEQTLEVCRKIGPVGSTSLAAAMWPYYDKKEWVDTVVMVSDEEENTNSHGNNFAQLMKKYKDEVNPDVVLVVVCVGSGDARFRQSLDRNGIKRTTVYIDNRRPDLTKFDALLGQIALLSRPSVKATKKEATEPKEEKANVKVNADEKKQTDQNDDDFVLVS